MHPHALSPPVGSSSCCRPRGSTSRSVSLRQSKPAESSEARGPIPFRARRFQVLLTLFSKFFSSFVHTTCSLSVSEQYLAFAEVHQRISTAIPNCATLGGKPRWRPKGVRRHGAIALYGGPSQVTSPHSSGLAICSVHYNSTASGSFHRRFMYGLFPVHSPLLRKSLLFSFPPLINMLKFSGFSCTAEVEVCKE